MLSSLMPTLHTRGQPSVGINNFSIKLNMQNLIAYENEEEESDEEMNSNLPIVNSLPTPPLSDDENAEQTFNSMNDED